MNFNFKECNICKILKDFDEFYYNKTQARHSPYCKKCSIKKSKIRNKKKKIETKYIRQKKSKEELALIKKRLNNKKYLIDAVDELSNLLTNALIKKIENNK